MIRKLLATTVLAAILVVPAAAQTSSSSSSSASSSSVQPSSAPSISAPSSSAPLDASSAPPATTSRAPVTIITGYARVDTDRLATRILGMPVYDSTAADANNLGDINDLVLNESGEVAAVVLGVGGFLGLGEKQVAVDYTALQWSVAADNTERFVLQTTVDELTQAPDFTTVDDNPADDASASSVAP